ncbi:MAG: hypothetical protein IPJ32_08340 [Sphingobacteriaceae bacterium]|nr:hypothetical protein [Sphingobacteriaceae bacterium]
MGWVRWEKSYGGFNNDIGKSIIQLADSGFVIAGYTNSFGAGGYDMLVVRTDKAGTLIWQKTFGGLDWDFANAVKTTPLGDSLIIVGSTYSFGYGKMDGYIVKTDLNGIFQWQKHMVVQKTMSLNLLFLLTTTNMLLQVQLKVWVM